MPREIEQAVELDHRPIDADRLRGRGEFQFQRNKSGFGAHDALRLFRFVGREKAQDSQKGKNEVEIELLARY
jgi:hypothetical protein